MLPLLPMRCSCASATNTENQGSSGEKATPRVRNTRPRVNDSPRILHSSPAEEKKLGFPFSENGPSAIQGEAPTAPFSDLGEWQESVVTTPIVGCLPPPMLT